MSKLLQSIAEQPSICISCDGYEVAITSQAIMGERVIDLGCRRHG